MRHEFSRTTKRAAVKRANGRCEAVGEVYGLEPGQLCNADLGRGLEIDHYPIPATDTGSDTLENAVVCCKLCHRHKTSTFDIPMQAKGKRISDRHMGIRQPSKMRGHSFVSRPKQHTATREIIRKSDRSQP